MTTPPPRRASGTARDRLLAVAGELFYAEGIRAVGIDRLLLEAGVAKASLYQHFASKDELVAAYLEHWLAQSQTHQDDALASAGGDAARQVVVFFEVLGRWMTSSGFRGCPFINAAAEFPEPDHPVHRAVMAHREQLRARLRSLAVAVPGQDPDQLTITLMMLYDGALVAADLDGPSTAARAVVSAVQRLVGPDDARPRRPRKRAGGVGR